MQIDKQPFPMNTLELQGKKMLIRPEMAESANKNNVVAGEPRNSDASNKVSGREIVLGKQPVGKETLKITIKILHPGGNHKSKRRFVPSSSSLIAQRLASGRLMRSGLSAKRLSQPSTCCCPSTNQSTGSNSNHSLLMKRPRSPPRERYSRHMRPYGQWAPEPWMSPPPMCHTISMEDGCSPQRHHMLFTQVGQYPGSLSMTESLSPFETI
jgi:hypothetical protein